MDLSSENRWDSMPSTCVRMRVCVCLFVVDAVKSSCSWNWYKRNVANSHEIEWWHDGEQTSKNQKIYRQNDMEMFLREIGADEKVCVRFGRTFAVFGYVVALCL